MIPPSAFAFNEQTAGTNAFQKRNFSDDKPIIHKALSEFERMVQQLRDSGIEVIIPEVFSPEPDAVFPNNWISFHHNGTAVLYPMLSENRRAERNNALVIELNEKYQFKINKLIDLTARENEGKFLEGTGSLVFDHVFMKAYACLSARTNHETAKTLCEKLNYSPVIFSACVSNGIPVYHTNVMMSIGEKFAVICSASILNTKDRKMVLENLSGSRRNVIEISLTQMETMAGNILELKSNCGKNFTVISETAYQSLESGQKAIIEKESTFIVCSIPTIETTGGGGVRCMMAEIFCPKEVIA